MKRILDVVVSVVGVGALTPLMVLVAILIRVVLGSPVLFRQMRAGLLGQPFEMMKFRTMRSLVDKHGNTLSDEARLCALGRLLRSMSLDELPTLYNVLRGEMSLVGPRPLLLQYLDRYTPEQMRRHHVRPGITGWAQINGRNAIGWEEKFEFDLWYVDHQSFILDLKILCMTVFKVFKRSGISFSGHATMPEFLGSPVECKTSSPFENAKDTESASVY